MSDVVSVQFEETVLREEWCVVAFKTRESLESNIFSRSQVVSPQFPTKDQASEWLYKNSTTGPWLDVRKSKIVEQRVTRRIYE